MKVYLGDGAYVEFDGYGFEVSAPRAHGDDRVVLGTRELAAFLRFIDAKAPGLIDQLRGGGPAAGVPR